MGRFRTQTTNLNSSLIMLNYIWDIMQETTANTIMATAGLIYNFALVALASYLVAFHNWSLWTYVGFAFFVVSVKTKTTNTD